MNSSSPPRIRGLSRVMLPLTFAIAYFFLAQASRIILAVAFPPATSVPAKDWIRVVAHGVHFDLEVALLLFLPVLAACMAISQRIWATPRTRYSLLILAFLGWFGLTFTLVSEGFFYEEFQSRFNPVAIDYLIYPHEVFINIWDSYPIVWVAIAVAVLAGTIVRVAAGRIRSEESRIPVRNARPWVIGWICTALLLLPTMRPSWAKFSTERSVNELASNTFISLATAAWTRHLDYAAFYPTMPQAEAEARVRQLIFRPDATFITNASPVGRRISGDSSRPKLNLVLLLEESLGSEFWGCLGRTGESLTPRMDALVQSEGILFENIYADGNRTIRGYEGVFSSFPPLPGDSIVARDQSDHVETIARVLSRDAYDTTFLYAGRGVFDGTRAFARANGWSNFIELKDFKSPSFTTVWGVCNEDLYDRILVECRDRHARGLPFLMTSMSVSNHKPYTYPQGRIPADPHARPRNQVVRYSDFALGRFFEMARKEPFWTNTIFAVVADHGARVYGSQTIPIRSYEIPFVVFGPSAAARPARIATLGCQLDVAPTLLGLIGRPYQSAFFGRDLMKWPDAPGRCLLHHNRSVGIYQDEHLVVFNLNKRLEYFSGDPKAGQMNPVTSPDALHSTLAADATALFQVADRLYTERRFSLDPPDFKH